MRSNMNRGIKTVVNHPLKYKTFLCVLWASFTIMAFLSCSRKDDEKLISVDLSKKAPLLQTDKPTSEKVYLFGMGHRNDPIEQDKIYTPFLKYLEKATGYTFELRFFAKDFESCYKNLGQGAVDFAILGPICSARAQKQYGTIRLVCNRTPEDIPPRRTAIFTRPESDIETIGDLRGRSVAFTCPNCVLGHHAPRDMLLEHGITLRDLGKYAFLGSCDRCAEKVLSGAFEVGCMEARKARGMAKKGRIKIIAVSEKGYPNASIDANADVDPEVAARVRDALLAFDPLGTDKDGLYQWEKSRMPAGFVEHEKSEHHDIHEMLTRFGLAEESSGQ